MQFPLPKSSVLPLVKVTVTAPGVNEETVLDSSHSTYTLTLENPKSARVTAILCDQFGKPGRDEQEVVLQEAEKSYFSKPKPEPKKPEPVEKRETLAGTDAAVISESL